MTTSSGTDSTPAPAPAPVRASQLPPSLLSNLKSALAARPAAPADETTDDSGLQGPVVARGDADETGSASKPVVLVTNGEGIGSPGIAHLVDALVRNGGYQVFVCAPDSNKSTSGHSITVGEIIAASSTYINGAAGFEVSGSTADCVSLAFSGALFSWSRPKLVVSGVNKGSTCGHHSFYSGAVAGAREASLHGIPTISFSLNWKNDESKENDFKDAAGICLPLIHVAIQYIEKGNFPSSCFLKIEIPTAPSSNKGFKITRQSLWRFSPQWQGVSPNRHPSAGQFMSGHQSLGFQLAQLGRDASAAGAARRLATQKKNIVEIESVASAKPENPEMAKKYFRMEFSNEIHGDSDEDLDFRALDDGFVSVTPIDLHVHANPEIRAFTSDWVAAVLSRKEAT